MRISGYAAGWRSPLIKGGLLVVMYFMHLRWDSPFNGIVILAALFFVALFIGLALHGFDELSGAD